jgi:succinoglycan biosynthesis transport protein ExoP
MAAPQNFVSVSRRPPDVEDYIDILRRYRSWIIGPTFAGLVVSVVVAYFTPDVYVCSAAMQIRPSVVSNQLLPSAINGQMQQKLQQLGLEILGRDNLIMMIQKPSLNLYPKERARYTVEDVAEEYFRKNVHIQPYGSDAASGSQAFRIVFSYPDKNVARAVVMELMTEFSSKDVVLQTETNTTTNNLFNDLVKNAKDNLEAKQTELAAFSSENQGRLPENFQSNAMEVQSRQAAVGQINQLISGELQRQNLLEASLNNNKNLQTQAEQNLTQSINTPNQNVRTANLTNIEQNIQAKQQECIALGRRFQENYPDVLTCKEQLKSLEDRKVEIERAEPAPQPASTSRVVVNPQAKQELDKLKQEEQNIRAAISASQMQVGVLQRNLAEQTAQLRAVQEKIASGPQVTQKFTQLSSELQMARDEYASLSTKRESAGTQQQVQEHQAGEKLEVLEQPIPPDKPTSPVRPMWIGIGTVMGLVLGIALAGAKEVKNTSLKNLKDVRAYTNLPVLSSIPLLENALLVRRKRRLAWLAWSSALIVGAILMSGAIYYRVVLVPAG